MVWSNALGVVIMMAEPSTEVAAPDVATDVSASGTEAEATPEAVLAAELGPVPQAVPTPEPMLVVEPEPEDAPPNTKWRGGPYITLGFAPMATMDINANFHPGLRYDVEAGLAWKRGRMRAYFGPDFRLMQYFGRKKVGFGVDAMATFTLRHVYARVGAGTAVGMPAGPDVKDTRPMLGGLLGAGLVGRLDDVEGRMGVDYDVRVDTTGRMAQTVLVTMRLTFGP
jgi:hypothetical protein